MFTSITMDVSLSGVKSLQTLKYELADSQLASVCRERFNESIGWQFNYLICKPHSNMCCIKYNTVLFFQDLFHTFKH